MYGIIVLLPKFDDGLSSEMKMYAENALKSALLLLCLLGLPVALIAQNPVPFVNDPVVPVTVAPGGHAFTLTVNGTGFVAGAEVKWNDTPLVTAFISYSHLTASVPASLIRAVGTASITVINPGPSAPSNVVFLSIVAKSSTVFYANAVSSPIFLGGTENALMEPSSMALGDFNGDGKLDIALGMNQSGNPSWVSVFLGNGDGTFTPGPLTLGTGVCPCSMVAGDFNGDGKLDLAVANYGNYLTGSTGDTVTILLGNGDGSFTQAPGSPVTVGNSPGALAEGDFNGDGNLDLAVANAADDTITILLGKGDGTFTPALVSPATGLTPSGLAIGDFNGDGKLDLAVANFDTAAINILLGNGDGTFTPAPSPAAPASDALVTGDFNGDGKLDLAVSSRGNDILTILLGNGDGTFTPVVGCCGTSLGLTHTLAMAIGDFNGDGNLDLVLAVQNLESLYPADYIEVFLGNGNGGFTPTDFSLLLPNDAYSFAVGDFNGDGMLDLATASQPDNYVSVLLQTPPSATPPDFSVAATNTPVSIQPGGTATFQIQVSSLNGFLGSVSLSCSGTPAEASCSVMPSPIYLFDTVIDVSSLTVTTTAPSLSSTTSRGLPLPLQGGRAMGLWAVLLVLIFVATQTCVRQQSARVCALELMPFAMALMCVVCLASCGGNVPVPPTTPSGGTPAGTYTLAVTAVSGSLSHSTTVTLTVQ